MLTKPIPATGEALPAIGLGTYKAFDCADTAANRARLGEVLGLVFAAGGTVVDSSPMYGRAERMAGAVLGDLGRRAETFVMTKVWTEGREAGLRQMGESLRHFGGGAIDLMQIHNLVDWRTQMASLRAWKAEGRIRYIGLTHYTVRAFDELMRASAETPVDFLQFPYSIAVREAEKRLLPFARERGIATISNRPFEGGDIFARVHNTPVPGWAAEFGADTWPRFFLKYLLGHGDLTCVIPATQNPAHAADMLGAGAGRLPDAAERRRMAALIDDL